MAARSTVSSPASSSKVRRTSSGCNWCKSASICHASSISASPLLTRPSRTGTSLCGAGPHWRLRNTAPLMGWPYSRMWPELGVVEDLVELHGPGLGVVRQLPSYVEQEFLELRLVIRHPGGDSEQIFARDNQWLGSRVC